MAAPAKRDRDGPNISSIVSRTHAVIPSALMVVPDDAERVIGSQSFADLTGQDRTLHGWDNGSLKIDQNGLSGKFIHQLLFIPQDGTTLLLQLLLLKSVPEIEIKWVGRDGGVNFATRRECPSP